MIKKIFLGLGTLSVIAGSTASVLSCGKQANAVLPVEVFVKQKDDSHLSFRWRTDRSDIRTFDDKDSTNANWNLWNVQKTPSSDDLKKNYGGYDSITNGSIGISSFVINSIKVMTTAYASWLNTQKGKDAANIVGSSSDYYWYQLFQKMFSERSGNNSTMIEMSQLFLNNSGEIFKYDDTNAKYYLANKDNVIPYVAPAEKEKEPKPQGYLRYAINEFSYNSYSTKGNSPDASYTGTITDNKKTNYFHFDVKCDKPIYYYIPIANAYQKKDTTNPGLYDVNQFTDLTPWLGQDRFFTVDDIISNNKKPDDKDPFNLFKKIIEEAPNKDNNYKSVINNDDFRKIFGDAKPIALTY